MRLAFLLPFLFLTSVLSAQPSANEQTMARLAKELTAKMNGKKLRKVAVLRLSFQDDPGTAEGAWLADEMAFALQVAGPDFTIIPRAEIEQKTAAYAERQASKSSGTSLGSSYEEETYEEETYEEETYTEEEYTEEPYEESYEDPLEEETYEEGEGTEKSYTSEKSGTTSSEQAAKKKKKNTGLLIGGALLAAGAVALFAGNKKPMAGVKATITGNIVEQGGKLVVTFRAVDRKGRVLAMTRGRFVRED